MRLAVSLVTASVLIWAPLTRYEAAPVQTPRDLVGMWRVVRFCDRDSTGAMVEPLGPNPIGYFVYAPTGELSIQVMRTPPSGPLAGEPVQLPALGALRPYYFGYFGTYTIISDTTVIHHVQGGTFPEYIGTNQRRTYHIRGDTLSIGAPSFPCRILIRIRGDA